MLNFKYRTSLFMTSGLLLLTSFAHAADDDYEAQLQYILKLSEQTVQEDALRRSQSERRSPIQQVEISYEDQLRIALALSAEESSPKKEPVEIQQVENSYDEQMGIALALSEEKNSRKKEPVEQQGTKHEAVMREDGERRQKEAQVRLANYIVYQHYAIRSNAQYLIEAIEELVEHPHCLCGGGEYWKEKLIKEDPLELKNTQQAQQGWFEKFCGRENLNYDTALPLFSRFWDRIEQNESIKLFQEVNQQLKKVLEINADRITTLLQNENFFQDLEDEVRFKKEIESFGISDLFHKINNIKQEAFRFIDSVGKETPEEFLAQSPAINWDLLLNKQEVVPPVAEKVEDKKPKIFMRPVLEDSLIGFQQALNFEFESRQGKGGDETVMAFGSRIAKSWYEEIERNMKEIWGKIDFPRSSAQPVNTIDQIIALHNRAKPYLGHGDGESREIKEILDTSYKRHTEAPMTIYLRDKTQYDYLRMVFSQVLRLDEAIRKQNENNANDFLSLVFHVLLGQMEEDFKGNKKIACQAGMTGRLFQIHKMTLDALIEYYNSPVKMGE